MHQILHEVRDQAVRDRHMSLMVKTMENISDLQDEMNSKKKRKLTGFDGPSTQEEEETQPLLHQKLLLLLQPAHLQPKQTTRLGSKEKHKQHNHQQEEAWEDGHIPKREGPSQKPTPTSPSACASW